MEPSNTDVRRRSGLAGRVRRGGNDTAAFVLAFLVIGLFVARMIFALSRAEDGCELARLILLTGVSIRGRRSLLPLPQRDQRRRRLPGPVRPLPRGLGLTGRRRCVQTWRTERRPRHLPRPGRRHPDPGRPLHRQHAVGHRLPRFNRRFFPPPVRKGEPSRARLGSRRPD